jgi:heme-degrading monooxygenase HmoA
MGDEEKDSEEPSGAVVTVFRSTLRPEAIEEYEPLAEQMVDLARAMPGFVDYKTFAADDGERVTVVTFATMEDHQAWRSHRQHREAQRLGRERLYDSFAIQVCRSIREVRFER